MFLKNYTHTKKKEREERKSTKMLIANYLWVEILSCLYFLYTLLYFPNLNSECISFIIQNTYLKKKIQKP